MVRVDQLLRDLTGHDGVWWCARVQALIQGAGDWAHEIHPECDVAKWISELAGEIDAAVIAVDEQTGRNRNGYDENMMAATALAAVLGEWAIRIGRAKAYDPNRPVALRRQALVRTLFRSECLADAVLIEPDPEPRDAAMFPGQQWEDPFDPHATDGTFV